MVEKKSEIQPACASCKHQRKKCQPGICTLAPFFPAERSRDFQAVHDVFGVCNVQKMILKLNTYEERSIAVNTLIWEANQRLSDPIHGCWGDYKMIHNQVQNLQDQVQSLHDEVINLRNQTHQQRMRLSKYTRFFSGNFEQQNYSASKSMCNNYCRIGSGGIGTSNNDMMNDHIDFGSSLLSTSQHNQDYSFTDLSHLSMEMKVELMNQFDQANIKALDHLQSNSLIVQPNLDISSLCDTSWEEAPYSI